MSEPEFLSHTTKECCFELAPQMYSPSQDVQTDFHAAYNTVSSLYEICTFSVYLVNLLFISSTY